MLWPYKPGSSPVWNDLMQARFDAVAEEFLRNHPRALTIDNATVRAWLRENGVISGATAEQAEQIEANRTAIEANSIDIDDLSQRQDLFGAELSRKVRTVNGACPDRYGDVTVPLATSAEMQKFVNTYCEKNGVQAGATTEQAAQIEQNAEEIHALLDDTYITQNGNDIAWEVGSLNNTGVNMSGTTRARMKNFQPAKKGSVIQVKTGYQMRVCCYSSTSSSSLFQITAFGEVDSFTVPQDCYIRVAVTDGSTELTADTLSVATDGLDLYIIIGTQTGSVKDDLSALEGKVDTSVSMHSSVLGIGTTTDYSFIAGGISSNGTVNDSAQNRVRSQNYIWAKCGSTISVKSGSSATFNVAAYSGTDTSTLLSYRGMSSEMYTVTQDCYIRFGFTATDTSDPDAVAASTIDLRIIVDTLPDIRAEIDNMMLSHGIPITDAIGAEYDFDGDFVNPYVENKINTLYQLWDALATDYPDFVSVETLGQDASGTYDIRCYTIKSYTDKPKSAVVPRDNLKIVWMGGIHGTENHMLFAAYAFFKDLLDNHNAKDILRMLWNNCTFMVVPVINPWGVDNNSKFNCNGVNLNRNFNASWDSSSSENGSAPESEIETQIAVDFIKANTDAFIVVNAHNSSSVTDAGGVGYTASNFYTDNLYSNLIGRKIDTALKTKFPFICAEVPDWKQKNLWYTLQSTNKGTMDKWFNYALGLHGFLLELCPSMGTDFPSGSNEIVQKINTICIGIVLSTFVQQNRDILADDTQIQTYSVV